MSKSNNSKKSLMTIVLIIMISLILGFSLYFILQSHSTKSENQSVKIENYDNSGTQNPKGGNTGDTGNTGNTGNTETQNPKGGNTEDTGNPGNTEDTGNPGNTEDTGNPEDTGNIKTKEECDDVYGEWRNATENTTAKCITMETATNQEECDIAYGAWQNGNCTPAVLEPKYYGYNLGEMVENITLVPLHVPVYMDRVQLVWGQPADSPPSIDKT